MEPESSPLSLDMRVDGACDRFETAWKAGPRPRIEDYLAGTPEAECRALLRALLALEIELRRKDGDRPAVAEYDQRFPTCGELIQAAFAEARLTDDDNGARAEPSTGPPIRSDDSPSADGSTPLAADPPAPLPDQIGRYKVCGKLGGGTFGDVYLANDPVMDRPVAIKVPSVRLLASQDARNQFLAEARSVARLQHEGIVHAYDFGEEADGKCYIVYEFIEGINLKERLRGEQLEPDEAARIVAQLAEALHYAHLHGVVHRDIKPANILLDRQGKPRLTDFGLAVREEDLPQERGRLAGTLPYMSPEQVRREGHHIDGRTDIYSLGVVLYELLCGRRPFDAKMMDDLQEQILHREAKPPRQINDSLSAELERITLKALSKRATERYTTAKDLSAELLAFLETGQQQPSARKGPGANAGSENLLHRIWDSLDSNLQDAFSLAYNKKCREGSTRISTRDLFQALLRMRDTALRTLLESLPEAALPDPIGVDVGVDRQLLNANPLLSDCVEDSLSQFLRSAPLPRKLSPVDIFVDIGQYGHGPSVARLRKHGITAEELEKRVEKYKLSIVRRQTEEQLARKRLAVPRQTALPDAFGPFAVVQMLEQDPSADIYLGHHVRSGRQVSIIAPNARYTETTKDELTSWRKHCAQFATARHPGVAKLHHIGIQNEQLYVVTDYLDGISLSTCINKKSLAWKEAAKVTASVADTLTYLHSRGIVHSGIKAWSIVLAKDLFPVLCLPDPPVFQSGAACVGGLGYLAPEQLSGNQADGRADLFSLGVLLYEMLCGKHPFAGSSYIDTMFHILEGEPVPLRQFAPEIPAELERICRKAMAKHAQDRYSTGADLAADLRRCLEEVPTAAALPNNQLLSGSPEERRTRPLQPITPTSPKDRLPRPDDPRNEILRPKTGAARGWRSRLFGRRKLLVLVTLGICALLAALLGFLLW